MIAYGEFSEVVTATLSQPAIIADGNSFAFWDFNTGITKNASNEVSAWADSLGSANTLSALSGAKPIWSADGITTLAAESGLGTGVKTLNQPAVYYVCVSPLTGVNGKTLVDGNAVLSACIYMNNSVISIGAYAGALVNGMGALPSEMVIIRVCFNGANSWMQLNNNKRIYGNFGTGNPSGITIGRTSNAIYKGLLVRKNADTADNDAAIYSFLRAKYSLNK